MKIAICDDEAKDAKILIDHCHACNLSYESAVFPTAAELLCAFSSDFYDLVFLDIEMAPPNGYEVGANLAAMNPRPLIVFTTISQQYAVRGYGIAFRYLCKPITLQMFRQTIEEAQPYLFPQKITLSYGGIQKLVSVNDILYFESLSHHLIFHLTEHRIFETKDSIEHMLQMLPHSNFLQVHRSFCINLNYIDYIKPPLITMTDGSEISISRNKQKELQRQFNSMIRSKRL